MKNHQRGQILLVVILVMTIALTVSLSVAARSITGLRNSFQEESSQRAFSAAEAGIEKTVQNLTGSSGSFNNNTITYQTTIATLAGIEFLLNSGAPVLKDDPADVWFSTYPNYTNPWSGDMTIYWGLGSDVCDPSEDVNTMAALEIVLISGTKDEPRIAHYAVDPCTPPEGNRVSSNQFEAIPAGGRTIGSRNFAYHKEISVDSGLLMRIIPLYAATPIGIRGCDELNANCTSLPVQSTQITSVGTADTTQRKIVGTQENPKLPLQIFPYLIFSPK